ncbi:MAG: hypothetical protein Q9M91_04700 [Candidatus Dojkabacteria bacterium]|nr:hypothetical protein [Candidatus Dojkabacteria bacterium]MDQ7021109.1 hypothetical protein [Candidatus Dojkabacteria bacterium]
MLGINDIRGSYYDIRLIKAGLFFNHIVRPKNDARNNIIGLALYDKN